MAFPLMFAIELEGCVIAWDFLETIRPFIYTYCKECISIPSEVFDTIHDERIIERAESVTKEYDNPQCC